MTFICDSQAVIDKAPERLKKLCILGTEEDAAKLLADNQAAFIDAKRDIFSASLQTAVEDGVIWTQINLDTEPQNIDKKYFILDVTTGLYEDALGLDSAKALIKEMHKRFLLLNAIDHYYTEPEWLPEVPTNLPPPEGLPLPPNWKS